MKAILTILAACVLSWAVARAEDQPAGPGHVVQPTELEMESRREIANHLLFLFNSERKVMSLKQIEEFRKTPEAATSRVFLRIYDERQAKGEEQAYLAKEAGEEGRGAVVFGKGEIRRATYMEMMELGEPAMDVLLKGVNSPQKGLRQGVLSTLASFKDDRILRIYQEVIFSEGQGGNKFTTADRQYVALGIYKYLDSDGGRRVFSKCLGDSDPYVRLAVLKSLPKMDRQYAAVLEPMLLDLYQREKVDALGKAVAQRERDERIFAIKGGGEAESKTTVQVLHENQELMLPMLRALEAVILYAPGSVAGLKLEREWYKLNPVGRLLVENSAVLNKDLRELVLKHYLRQSADILLQRTAIASLTIDDKEAFSEDVAWVLGNSVDAPVLSVAIRLSGDWQLKGSSGRLKEISDKDYRSTIRTLAADSLSKLR